MTTLSLAQNIPEFEGLGANLSPFDLMGDMADFNQIPNLLVRQILAKAKGVGWKASIIVFHPDVVEKLNGNVRDAIRAAGFEIQWSDQISKGQTIAFLLADRGILS